MSARGTAIWILAASLVTGALAFADAWQNHSGVLVPLAISAWAATPSALAALLLWRRPQRLSGPTAFGVATGLGGLIVFAAFAIAPPPDPDTARHLAPLLWPVLILAGGLALSGAVWLVDLLWFSPSKTRGHLTRA